MPIRQADGHPVELPPSLDRLKDGTLHYLGDWGCACGTGPHHQVGGRTWSSREGMRMTVSFRSLADDPAFIPEWLHKVEIRAHQDEPTDRAFLVLELLVVETERPDWWIPPAPPRTPEQVDYIRWVNETTIEVVQWGYSDEPFGSWQWRKYQNRTEYEMEATPGGWASVYWQRHRLVAVCDPTREGAIEHLREGEEHEDLSPVGIIQVGAEAGEFWKDTRSD